MKSSVWTIIGLAAAFPLVLVCVLWASSGPKKVLRVNPRTGDYYEIEFKSITAATDEAALSPKAEVKKQEFDFGALDPFVDSSHTFQIHNAGPGKLLLQASGSTCKCMKAKVVTPEVAAGDTGLVRVEWSTIYGEGPFDNSVTVMTNDQAMPSIKLRVQGQIRYHFFSDPDAIVFSDLLPSETQETRITVFSQQWDSFEILDVSTDMPCIRWEITPASAEKLADIRAKCGYSVLVTAYGGFEAGTHTNHLRFKIQADGEPNPSFHDVELRVTARGRLGLYSPKLNSDGDITLGRLRTGQGAHVSLIAKVRDAETALAIKQVDAKPNFIQATLEPMDAPLGLYRLNIDIPRDAPAGFYTGRYGGKLQLSFDHPRIEPVQLNIDFEIVE